jgi:hypothetical protein
MKIIAAADRFRILSRRVEHPSRRRRPSHRQHRRRRDRRLTAAVSRRDVEVAAAAHRGKPALLGLIA